MGTTPNLLLPYPELGDPANVPVDMKELCDRIEQIVGGPLPSAVWRQVTTSQPVNVTTGLQNLNPTVSLANPHTSLYLTALVQFGIWVDARGNVFYGDLVLSNAAGSGMVVPPRVEDNYLSAVCSAVVTIAPSTTFSATFGGRKLSATPTVSVASVRGSVTPTGWAKTGAIS